MAFVPSNSNSITGKWLYSDYYGANFDDQDCIEKTTFLNRRSTYPIIGIAAGVSRCALATIHIIGHLFAALIFRDQGHLAHAFKGCAEFCRGIIEAIPIVGRIFSIAMNPTGSLPSYLFHGCPGCRRIKECYSFFLIKIYNPKKLDEIDQAVINLGYITADKLQNQSGGFIRPLTSN
jgi:hypothetical protein